ncbi:uncharacterized protein PV07_02774 [Cladophialophora immunda]|uniref:Uncharacterized protein n=1 Tax=Cladophialophora immunda TaxID=569365 RepID=A0A0D2CIY6_9EURO|nr:uncharacterized protein PV07_02774 [Cladophialophora immunda]KIW31093.1 hypothetical protein PV07_02774 [Cladophialophora immunda]
MTRQIPRPRWTGGDSRSSAWFGLARLCMHDEYMRVEAIRRSRRDRACATLLTQIDIEAVAANTSGGDREVVENEPAKEEVIDEEEPHAGEAEEEVEDVQDPTAVESADIEKATENNGAEARESGGNQGSNNPVISPAHSATHSDRVSNVRSHARSDQPRTGCQAQETAPSPQRSKAPSVRTTKSQKTAAAQSEEVDRESQRPPSSRRMSAASSGPSKHAKIIAPQQNTENNHQDPRQVSSPRPSTQAQSNDCPYIYLAKTAGPAITSDTVV